MTSNQEDAKNLALLFFMDHLMQKNGTRTIHDLSCQFGARGFTAEMRDAVGSTQEGLCDFLRQYPSLFTIDSDTVTLNGYGEIAIGGMRAVPLIQNLTRDRDIQKEAVEFFEIKLKKFGPELQIKSLLGHRSQAAPEIRMYSGRHVKDFTEFLQMHSEMFIVEGDRVRLKNMPEPSDPEMDLDENGVPLVGVRAKQVALEYLKALIEVQEAPLPMETLYKQFCTRFSHQVRQEVATNPKELMQFLKLHRHLFFIRSNKVSIVRNRDGMSDGSEPIGAISPALFAIDPIYGTEYAVVGEQIPDFSTIDVLEVTAVLKTLHSAREAVQEVASMYTDPKSAYLTPELSNAVAMDFKIVTLASGQDFLTLVTLATPFGKLYVFDVANSASILLESGLKDLLEADDYVKIIHDCKKISTLLWQQYQIHVQAVFDTQIANAVLQHQRTGRPLHEIRPVSFLTLQRLYYPQSLMTEGVPRRTQKRDPKYWSLRPLTDDMIRLAVEEVHALMPVIFVSMHGSIKPELFELFWHLCRENADFFIKHQEVQVQRQERRNRYTMNVINEKLTHDPTGATLTSREKKVLAGTEQIENGEVAPLEQQEYYIPWVNREVTDAKTVPLQELPTVNDRCTCRCHQESVGRVDAEVQTVPLEDIDSDYACDDE